MRAAIILVVALALAGCVAPAVRRPLSETVAPLPAHAPAPLPLRPLATVIADAPDLTRFRALAAVGGLDRLLAGTRRATVLAPTDAAFARLPTGTVEALLLPGNRPSLLHLLRFWVLAGSDALDSTDRARTLDGEAIAVTPSDVTPSDVTMLTDAAGRRGYVVGRMEATDGMLVELNGIIAPRSIEPGMPSPARR